MNRRPFAWQLTVVLCLAAAGFGYLLAGGSASFTNATRGNRDDRGASLSERPGSLSSVNGAALDARRVRSESELAALKRDLRVRFGNSPYAWEDWALREQAAAILAKMSAEELEAFAKEFDGESDDPGSSSTTSNHALRREIMRQWALKDPGSASLFAAQRPERNNSFIFEDWLKRDLPAAEKWLMKGSFSEGDKAAVERLKKSFLSHKVAEDFDSAREYWTSLDPKNRREVLIDWGASLANDPARRSELLRLLQENGDEEVRLESYKRLASAMANKSPKEAVEFVEASDLPEAGKDALYNRVLGQWSEKDPKAALEWWKGLDQGEAPPKGLMGGVFMMAITKPDEISKWVRDLPAGPGKEGFEDGLMESLLAINVRKAADFSVSIEDPARRQRNLREVFRRLSEKGGELADKWVDTLPEGDRAAVRNP